MEESKTQYVDLNIRMEQFNEIARQINSSLKPLRVLNQNIEDLIFIIASKEEKMKSNKDSHSELKTLNLQLNKNYLQEKNLLVDLSQQKHLQDQIHSQLNKEINHNDDIAKKDFEQKGNTQGVKKHKQQVKDIELTIQDLLKEQEKNAINKRQRDKLREIQKNMKKKDLTAEKVQEETKIIQKEVERKTTFGTEKRKIKQNKQVELGKEKKQEEETEVEEEEKEYGKDQQQKLHFEEKQQERIRDDDILLNTIGLCNQTETVNAVRKVKNLQVDSSINAEVSTSEEQIETQQIVNITDDSNYQNLEQHLKIKELFTKFDGITEELKKCKYTIEQQNIKIEQQNTKIEQQYLEIKEQNTKIEQQNMEIDSLKEQVTDLEKTTINYKTMILNSSLIEIIYDKISITYYNQSWKQFKHERLSNDRDKDNNMKEFQKYAQEFLKISSKQWNILRKIKESRNFRFHESQQSIEKEENRKLILTQNQKPEALSLFINCFQVLDKEREQKK